MNIFLAILILIASTALIIFGGGRLVDSAVAIAKKLKIPTAVVGATIVSVCTTIPELLVAIFSVGSGASNIAVGNAFGSIIFNTCVIGGILLCFVRLNLKKGWHYEYLLLIATLVLTFMLAWGGTLGIASSIILLFIFVAFLCLNYFKARKKREQAPEQKYPKSIWFYILIFVISAISLGLGSYFMVESAKYLASMAGLSEIFIGLTIVSLGTSLPELITTINAIRKKEAGLGLGNIVGANVLNATLFVGLTGILAGGLSVSFETLYITIPVAIASVIVMLLPTLVYKRSFKWQGVVLIIMYAIYYAYLILNALGLISFI
ncbi:MAG: calcium/sodium antiporter [Clostridia bacterium]|nr:calcium/sodium antiporter [Clostridia bacterium]